MKTHLNGHANGHAGAGVPARLAEMVARFDAPEKPQAVAVAEPARILSPSQVSTYLGCQFKWWARYGLGLPSPRTAALALGSAVHAAIAENYRQKIETKRDLAEAGVVAVYREAWGREFDGVELRDEEDAGGLVRMGEAMVKKYIDEAAPRVEPAAVELRVEGEVGGVRVQGIVDVVEVDGTIVDIKTSAKSPSDVGADHRFQAATYVQLTPGASGAARIETLTKTKEVKFVSQAFTVNGADLMSTTVMYPLVAEGMRSGLYMPNRNSNRCSRKDCAYWRRCEQEFGGRVK